MEWRPSPGLRFAYVIIVPGLVAAACWFFAAALTQPGIWPALAIFVLGLVFLWSGWASLGALLSYVRIDGADLVALNWPRAVCRVRLASVAKVAPGRYGLEITTADRSSFRAVAVRDVWDRSAREDTRAARIAREIELAAAAAGRPPDRPPGLDSAWLVEELGVAGSGSALLIRRGPGAESAPLFVTGVALVPWLLVARWVWTGGDWPLWQAVLSIVAAAVLGVAAIAAWWRVPTSEAWLLRSGQLEIGSIHIRDRSWVRPPAAVLGLELAERVGVNDKIRRALVAVTRSGGRPQRVGGRRRGDGRIRRELAAADPARLGSWLAGRAGLPLTIGAEEPAVREARARAAPQAPAGWIIEPFPHADDADGDPGVLLRPPPQYGMAVFLTTVAVACLAGAAVVIVTWDGVLGRVFVVLILLWVGLGTGVVAWENAVRPEAWRLRSGSLDVGTIRVRGRRWTKPPATVTALEVVPDTGEIKARLYGVTATGERVVLWHDREDIDPGGCLRIGRWLADQCSLPFDDHTAEKKASPD